MNAKIVLKDLLPVVQQELDRCEHGEVSLILTISAKQIVRWTITRQFSSGRPVVSDPHPTDNV